MFDTSVVRAHAIAGSRRWILLTFSLTLHTLAALAVIVLTLTSMSWPRNPPNEMGSYIAPAVPALPQPLGQPEVRRAAQQAPSTSAPVHPSQVTAPAIMPEQIPAQSSEPASAGIGASGVGNEALGSPDGVPFGVGDGTAGPVVEAPPAVTPYWPGGEVRTARVLSRVEPQYPHLFAAARLTDVTVVARCIIDKQGAVRDVEIIRSSYAPFNDAVVEALRQWRFAPGSMRGQPVDTWFELTVSFRLR